MALLADLSALQVEKNRDRDHDGSQTAKESTSPLDTHAVDHVAGEEWEDCAADGTK